MNKIKGICTIITIIVDICFQILSLREEQNMKTKSTINRKRSYSKSALSYPLILLNNDNNQLSQLIKTSQYNQLFKHVT